MACDLKEIYGEQKEVTLVHSRDHIMPVYDEKLSEMIKERFKELGIKSVLDVPVLTNPSHGFH